MIDKESKIYIAGHRGLVGSAILNNLKAKGYSNFVLRTHEQLDLTNQQQVEEFFRTEQPEYVILAAAKVGGIVANNIYRADFIYENMMIQNNVIHQAYKWNVKKLVFLGSTCIYPKECPQPMVEDYLLTSPLEYTNEPYAVAKIAGIKMCESYNLQYNTNFIAVMPTNLYGPNDNFHLENSHVLPALIRKMFLAKCIEEKNWELLRADLKRRPIENINNDELIEEILLKLTKFGIYLRDGSVDVEIWGSGKPKREFLWSEDMADATVFIMENVDFADLSDSMQKEIRNTHINIGTGKEITIRNLAELIKETIGFGGKLSFNTSKPDGTMQKLTDVSKLHQLGWQHRCEIENGVLDLYNWYKNNLYKKY